MWRFRSLRWRLTFLYVALVTLLFAGMGTFVYNRVEQFMMRSATERLQDAVYPAVYGGKPASGKPAKDLNKVIENLTEKPPPPGVSLLVFSTYGESLPARGKESNQLTGTPYPDIDYVAAAGQEKVSTFIIPSEAGAGGRTLVYLLPVPSVEGSVLGLVQADSALGEVDSTLGRLRLLLIAATATAVALAVGLGLPLARVTLRPLDRMASTARSIADGDFKRRVGAVGSRDEIGKLAAAFDRMLDEIEAAFAREKRAQEKAKQFIADASHELRSPITALRGYTDVLLRGAKDDPATAEQVLLSMRRELERMSRLATDLLTLGRLDAGVGLELRDVDAVQLCREACDQARVLAEYREIAFQDTGPIMLRADPDRLKQVLLNLLENAIRHTLSEGRIEVGVQRDGWKCHITVSDNGEGIAPEHVPHVFDRFYRADPARSRATGGTGLGLAIVKAIVEAHQG